MVQIVSEGYDRVAIDSLRPHPENKRKGDVEKIRHSIRNNGFYGSVLVQRRTDAGEEPGFILYGEHRWTAGKLEGLEEIPVTWANVDDATALRIVLDDNFTSDAASYDQEGLIDLLRRYTSEELALTTYRAEDLKELERITGRAGREASAFLDDHGGQPNGNGGGEPARPAAPADGNGAADQGEWVTFSLTMRPEDRRSLLEKLAAVKRQYGTTTTAETLLRLVGEWTPTPEEQPA